MVTIHSRKCVCVCVGGGGGGGGRRVVEPAGELEACLPLKCYGIFTRSLGAKRIIFIFQLKL
jgi:hypothetical protein